MGSFKFTLTFSCLGVLCGLASGKSTADNWYSGGIPTEDYDCAGKADGTYPYPGDCNAYIACVEQGKAYKLSCGFSPDGYLLHYVPDSGPDPATSKCAPPADANCMPPLHPNTTTPAPPTAPPPSECQPNQCKQAGDCDSYWVCSEGIWTPQQCGSNLFWNPNVPNGFGGSCDYFGNLNQAQQDLYIHNPECIPPCEWWQNEGEKCTGVFHFREPFEANHPLEAKARESTLSCPTGGPGLEPLVWNQVTLTCSHKSTVLGC
ncbi:unnamed protein product [Allacma fusca]|uniref:Chitin-binding type-2 domain-containing protein n=1 Tax=Allacma fusca TaxID=39272 RepID=A0A8J2L7M8_9HEXA|nr:unnamed protein product [Allacma fusca]